MSLPWMIMRHIIVHISKQQISWCWIRGNLAPKSCVLEDKTDFHSKIFSDKCHVDKKFVFLEATATGPWAQMVPI